MTEPTNEDKTEAFDFLGRLNFILSKIRKNKQGIIQSHQGPVEPSNVQIEKVIFPSEGGVLTFYAGVERPTKGFPYGETVEAVDNVKRIIMTLVEGARGRAGGLARLLMQNKLKTLLFLFLFRKQIEEIALSLPQMFKKMLRDVEQDEKIYCRSVKELYRTLTVMIDQEKNEKIKMELPDMRDTLCMILEYDDAYRYRFQNIISELNKENLRNLIKELKRLFLIASKREFNERQAEKWKYISRFVEFLSFIKGMKKRIKIVLGELNLEEIKMDEDDLYHAKLKTSYDWEETKKE